MQAGPDNKRVNLPGHVQVLLYYTTAVVEEDGEVYFFDDIYGHDAKLAQLLAKGYRFGP
jgi:murein L,D-transpeptidase YcbB/YkuD